MKSDIEQRKRPDLTAIHKQIIKMDDTIIDSDILESVLKELLKQNVISNHETSHEFDSFFRKAEIPSSDENQ